MQWAPAKLNRTRLKVKLEHPDVFELSMDSLATDAKALHAILTEAGGAICGKSLQTVTASLPARLLFGAVYLYLYPINDDAAQGDTTKNGNAHWGNTIEDNTRFHDTYDKDAHCDDVQAMLSYILVHRFRDELMLLAWRLAQNKPANPLVRQLLLLLIPHALSEKMDSPFIAVLQEWMAAQGDGVEASLIPFVCSHMQGHVGSVRVGLHRLDVAFTSPLAIGAMTDFFSSCTDTPLQDNLDVITAYAQQVWSESFFPAIFTRLLQLMPVWLYPAALMRFILEKHGLPTADVANKAFWLACGNTVKEQLRLWLLLDRMADYFEGDEAILSVWRVFLSDMRRVEYMDGGEMVWFDMGEYVVVDRRSVKNTCIFIRKDVFMKGPLVQAQTNVEPAVVNDWIASLRLDPVESWYFDGTILDGLTAGYKRTQRLYLSAWLYHLRSLEPAGAKSL